MHSIGCVYFVYDFRENHNVPYIFTQIHTFTHKKNYICKRVLCIFHIYIFVLVLVGVIGRTYTSSRFFLVLQKGLIYSIFT